VSGAGGAAGGAVSSDVAAVTAFLGRAPAGPFSVARRRPDGTPAVIENGPFLFDGTPMPTRYWLVDPDLAAAVSRLESAGGVRLAEAEVDAQALASAHRAYAAGRDALVPTARPGPRPAGGVGGTRTGVKCLHAHLAYWLCGGADPVGGWVAGRLADELRAAGLAPPC
jgi:uncharacterized protein